MSTNAQNFGVSVSLDPNGHLRLTRFSRMRTLYVLLVAFECALRVLFVRVTTNDLFFGSYANKGGSRIRIYIHIRA